MMWSVSVQLITLSIWALSWKCNLLILQSWDLVICQTHTTQFKLSLYIVITQGGSGRRHNLNWEMMLLFSILREVMTTSKAQSAEMLLVVDQCQQPMQSLYRDLFREQCWDTLARHRFLATNKCHVFWPLAHKCVSVGLNNLCLLQGDSKTALQVSAHLSVAQLILAQNWILCPCRLHMQSK